MTECVLFDFFGTLVDYSHDRTTQNFARTHEGLAEAGLSMGYEETVRGFDAVFQALEETARATLMEFSMREAVHQFLRTNGAHADWKLADEIAALYISDWMQHVVLLEGIAPYLRSLSRRYRLGIITNTHYPPMITELLSRMGAMEHFEVIITSVEHGMQKPHPDIFHFALDQLGSSPEAAVYVGDSYTADYCGATGVGMDCYLIGRHARVPVRRQIPSVFDLPTRL